MGNNVHNFTITKPNFEKFEKEQGKEFIKILSCNYSANTLSRGIYNSYAGAPIFTYAHDSHYKTDTYL